MWAPLRGVSILPPEASRPVRDVAAHDS
jgi:hypothetical protein